LSAWILLPDQRAERVDKSKPVGVRDQQAQFLILSGFISSGVSFKNFYPNLTNKRRRI
jgi:hypothetical protein